MINLDNNQVVTTHLNELDLDSLINIHNDHCADINSDDHIYPMDDEELDDRFDSAIAALRSMFYGDFRPCDAYFSFDGNGNLISFSYLSQDNCPIDISELASWIVEDDLCEDYDIEVTTLSDKETLIEDHLSDADLVQVLSLAEHFKLPLDSAEEVLEDGYGSYEEYLAQEVNDWVYDDEERCNESLVILKLAVTTLVDTTVVDTLENADKIGAAEL